ncbi:MAG TPA: hypothetical protein VKZ18_21510 [Polyangia bacterium]|nr:hypothetical protein [Polyangia bacterium]
MSAAATTPAGGDRLVAPVLDALDGARRALLRRLGRSGVVAALRRRRELRLTVLTVISIAAAFAAAVLATLPLLLAAPLLFGVPHVVSDVRYLLVRRASRGTAAVSSAPVLGLLGASTALCVLGAGSLALAAAWAAVLCAGLAAPAGRGARVAFAALVLAAAALSLERPAAATVALAQGHNLVALALGAWVVRGKLRGGFVPAAVFVAGAAAIALGACDGLLRHAVSPGASWSTSSGFAAATFADVRAAVVPAGLAPVLALRCVALFAFAQSVHYGVWLRVVPDAERTSARPVSFRRSFRLLEDDLGPRGARIAVVLSLALPLAALLSAEGARRLYVQLSAFHGFIELAFVACFVLARSARRGAVGPERLA